MPKRISYLENVRVAFALTESDRMQASECYGFHSHTGQAAWPPVEGQTKVAELFQRVDTFVASLRFIPFADFANGLLESKAQTPALVFFREYNSAHHLPLFIWDERNDERLLQALSELQPCKWPSGTGAYLFGPRLWRLTAGERSYSADELRLVFMDAVDQDRRKFERLKAQFDRLAGIPTKPRREVIPEAVRIYVWRRDGGQCVQCASNEKLEYDHIIPVSKGGNSTERNVQLLCEPCNRRKSDTI